MIGKSILAVMIITVLSRLTGFIREISLASVYGTTLYTDAYLISTTIPSVIFSGIGVALETIFIPIYLYISKKEEKQKAISFANNLINTTLLLTTILCLISLLSVKYLVGIFASGFEGEVLAITIRFTKILLPGIIFIGINYILTGYLEANKSFEIPIFVKVIHNILIVAAIFLSAVWGIDTLLYATLLAIIIETLILLFFSFRLGYRYKAYIDFKDQNMRKMLYMIMPVFIGTGVQQINVLVDRTLASTLIVGSISALNFADKLISFVYGVFVASITTVIYPTLSQLAIQEDKSALKEYIRKAINIIIILIIPISVGAMCLNVPIIKVLFQRGQFDLKATDLTSGALLFYSIGMIGFGLRSVLNRVFFSLQDTKTPVINGCICVGINITLNIILIRYMEHKGLALATSISAIIGMILLLHSLKSKIGSIGGKKIMYITIKTCFASLIMGIAVKLFYTYNLSFYAGKFISESLLLFMSILCGGLIYLILMVIFNLKEVKGLVNSFIKKTY